MGPISLSTSVDASREDVFDFLVDLAARPGWTDHFIRDYHLQRIPPAGEGAAARFLVNAPAGIEYMETVIAEADRPHKVVEQGRGGRLDRVPMHTVWELKGGEGGVTTVELTFWTEPASHFDKVRGLGRTGWWRRRWKKSLSRMRELVEAGQATAPRVEVAGGQRLPAAAPAAPAAH